MNDSGGIRNSSCSLVKIKCNEQLDQYIASAKHDVVKPSGGLFLCSLAVLQKKGS